jgi:hypothetical protein
MHVEPNRFAFSVVTSRAIMLVVAPAQPTSSRTINHYPSTSFHTGQKKEGIEKQI